MHYWRLFVLALANHLIKAPNCVCVKGTNVEKEFYLESRRDKIIFTDALTLL